VGDGLAAGKLALCALDVHVDPLVVAGGLGEFVDHLLSHGQPLRRAELLADVLEDVLGLVDGEHLDLLVVGQRYRSISS
jgi:hypothetical protein